MFATCDCVFLGFSWVLMVLDCLYNSVAFV